MYESVGGEMAVCLDDLVNENGETLVNYRPAQIFKEKKMNLLLKEIQ